MKKLLLALTFLSPFSFADWGDVYYCQMTTFSMITLEVKRTDYTLEKFQFKLDKAKKAMVYGSTGFLSKEKVPLIEGSSWPRQESWFARDNLSHAYFKEGKFLYSIVGSKMFSISANCDKF